MLKVRSRIAFRNIYLEYMVMSLLFSKGKDGLKKLKQEEQHIMTNCRVVVLAPHCLGGQH